MCCYSKAKINVKFEQIAEVINDFSQNKHWNPIQQEAKEILQISDDCKITYMKTKKVAMVSSRDSYSVVFKRLQEKGKLRKLMLANKSKNLTNYPPISGAVRSTTILSGFIFDEIKEGTIECHFFAEVDPKISLFIMRQVGPKNANYAYYLKQYLE